ncbi:chromophore lyase CpcT/CpeT [Cyanobium sp. ATX 6F1]|uniref:chromophore lyase CpcT/CpeT n=1 Tax=unclassified Cyanobium TaxID=2627006 RepID=UPI0020CDED8D|nr:chromophore lyase CpcT/CpeT [Cyanobium sp. ATX 6F1]MCP9917190.1 chromophore lyase CpcT/CpeT [Cyanobium sp. ATX 6F1]
MISSSGRLLLQLSASFSNQRQAFANPPLYGHILVRFRPLPQLMPGSLLLEQAYAVSPLQPYRIRVLTVQADRRGLVIINHAIRNSRRFWGAVEDPCTRALIEMDDLEQLDGCTYIVQEQNDGFFGEVEPGCRCIVERQGESAYLVSSFQLDAQSMQTVDRGHHPQTHEQVWGSLAGPFVFERVADFSHELPEAWLA